MRSYFRVSRKSKNFNGKSGGAGFLITLGTIWLLSHGGPSGIVLGILIGAGIGLISSIMGSKLDTTTHNKQDVERRKREEAEKQKAEEARKQEIARQIPLTGDEAADQAGTAGDGTKHDKSS